MSCQMLNYIKLFLYLYSEYVVSNNLI